MIGKSLRDYLFPREESLHTGFAEEVKKLSVIGLRVLAITTLSATLLLWLVSAAFPEFRDHRGLAIGALFLSLAGAGLALSFWRPAHSRARAIGLVIGYIVSMTSLAAMMRPSYELSVDMVHAHMPIIATLSLLVHVVTLPLKPFQIFLHGLATLLGYLALTAALRTTEELTGMIALHVLLVFLVVLLGSGLTAVLYHQRVGSYRSRRLAEESFEELKAAQARLLLTRNAASQSRLAAALTHELATPLGVFASALDTMRVTVEKLLPSAPTGDKLERAARDALRAAQDSGARLQQTLARMKNVTNLDGAEERALDLNELWSDTVELLESEIAPKAEVRFQTRPVPRTLCRPEQISAVFSNLLRNAAAAMDARGVIEIRTTATESEVVSEVIDTGRGIAPEVLGDLFEPVFRVEGRRITTSNWGLFVSRSIIAEHGGSIEVESEPGQGTTVRVGLPVRASSSR